MYFPVFHALTLIKMCNPVVKVIYFDVSGFLSIKGTKLQSHSKYVTRKERLSLSCEICSKAKLTALVFDNALSFFGPFLIINCCNRLFYFVRTVILLRMKQCENFIWKLLLNCFESKLDFIIFR